MNKILSASVLILVLIAYPFVLASAESSAETVRQFLKAFNAHDPAAMAALVTDDVRWLSIRDNSLSVEVEGKANLVAAMSDYFQSCPSCRSEIHSLTSSRERVSAVEVASWVGAEGQQSQQSMAVYEFSGALIQAVYYFPEEAGP